MESSIDANVCFRGRQVFAQGHAGKNSDEEKGFPGKVSVTVDLPRKGEG